MRFVPNILSLSRVFLFTPLLIILMISQQLFLATMCLAVGIATDWLDGYVARKWNCTTQLGAGLFESACDLIIAGAAVTMLIIQGYWSIWLGIILLMAAGLLQAISWLADARPGDAFIMLLKRHQNYLHPFYAVIVMVLTLGVYVLISTEGYYPVSIPLFIVVTAVALVAKRERITTMMRWPM